VGLPSPSHLEQFSEVISCSTMEAWAFSYFFIRLTQSSYFFLLLYPRVLFSLSEELVSVLTEDNAFTPRWTSSIYSRNGNGVYGSQLYTPLLPRIMSRGCEAENASSSTTYFSPSPQISPAALSGQALDELARRDSECYDYDLQFSKYFLM
jgi:hypothetical protein